MTSSFNSLLALVVCSHISPGRLSILSSLFLHYLLRRRIDYALWNQPTPPSLVSYHLIKSRQEKNVIFWSVNRIFFGLFTRFFHFSTKSVCYFNLRRTMLKHGFLFWALIPGQDHWTLCCRLFFTSEIGSQLTGISNISRSPAFNSELSQDYIFLLWGK